MDIIVVPYLENLLSVAIIAVFMAISPGADFAMVTRNSMLYGRTAGIYSSLGISFAIWVHVAYSIAGLAVIISRSVLLFSIIKYFGAAYLIYIGWKTCKSTSQKEEHLANPNKHMSNLSALRVGFITNVLNPKTTIFFLSIFTQVMTPSTPLHIVLIYGTIISLAHLTWFSVVAILLTKPILLRKFNAYRNNIEKIVGGVLITFGLKVALTSNK